MHEPVSALPKYELKAGLTILPLVFQRILKIRTMDKLIVTLKQKERDVCATLIISGKPTSFDDKEKTLVKLRKSVADAGKILDTYGEETREALVDVLNEQVKQIDFRRASETLIVYATKGFGTWLWLPFPEKEAVTILNEFDIQPLIKSLALKRKYWVLALSKNKTRLFKGENDRLSEISDGNFPLVYEEQFEYEKQHYSLSHKRGAYSPDDSKAATIRFQAFIRHIDHLLANYAKADALPIVLLGVTHNLSDFLKVSTFSNRVVNTIKGNYDHHSAGQLAQKVWETSKGKLYESADEPAKTPLTKKQTA